MAQFTSLEAVPNPVRVGEPFMIIGETVDTNTVYMSGPDVDGLDEHSHTPSFTHPNLMIGTKGIHRYFF